MGDDLNYPFTVYPEADGGYTIVVPDLLGCMTVADTFSEIPEMLDDAIKGWIASARALGWRIPPPSDHV